MIPAQLEEPMIGLNDSITAERSNPKRSVCSFSQSRVRRLSLPVPWMSSDHGATGPKQVVVRGKRSTIHSWLCKMDAV